MALQAVDKDHNAKDCEKTQQKEELVPTVHRCATSTTNSQKLEKTQASTQVNMQAGAGLQQIEPAGVEAVDVDSGKQPFGASMAPRGSRGQLLTWDCLALVARRVGRALGLRIARLAVCGIGVAKQIAQLLFGCEEQRNAGVE